MIKFTGITVGDEDGQLRANDEMLAWKGSHSGTMLSVNLSAIKEAGWSQGQMRLRYFDESSGEDHVLGFAGFEADAYQTLNQHLESHAFLTIAVHQPRAAIEAAEEPHFPNLLETPAPMVNLDHEDIRKIACGEIVEEKITISRPTYTADTARDWACPETLPAVTQRIVREDADGCVTEEPDVVDMEPEAVPDLESKHPPRSSQVSRDPPTQSADRGGLVRRYIGRGADSSDEESFVEPVYKPSPAVKDVSEQAYPGSILEGWVWKQSRWMKRWRRRYLVLTSEGLLSYKCRGDPTPSYRMQGLISCTDQVADALASKQGVSQSFCLTGKHGRQFFIAETQGKQIWIDSISSHIRNS